MGTEVPSPALIASAVKPENNFITTFSPLFFFFANTVLIQEGRNMQRGPKAFFIFLGGKQMYPMASPQVQIKIFRRFLWNICRKTESVSSHFTMASFFLLFLFPLGFY